MQCNAMQCNVMVCIYVCMYVYIHVYNTYTTDFHVYIYMVGDHIYTHTHPYVYKITCIVRQVYNVDIIHRCTHVHTHTSVFIYIYINRYTCLSMYVYTVNAC